MRTGGKRSAEARAQVAFLAGQNSQAQPIVPGRRMAPPEGFSEQEVADWRALVDPLPTDWIKAEHRPLLIELVRHIGYSRQLATALAAIDMTTLATDAGIRHAVDDLQRMHRRQSTQIAIMATKLRLAPTSLYTAKQAKDDRKENPASGVAPWSDWGANREAASDRAEHN